VRSSETGPLHMTPLGRRTWGALAICGGALAALSIGIALFSPRTLPFVLVGLVLYAVIAATVAMRIAAFHPHDRFGFPNVATLLRGTVACLCLALSLEALILEPLGATASWLLFGVATAAAALDALDGWAARRQGLLSRFGARFDMEMDALFILSLSALALGQGKAGPWILLAGLMRYAFFLAGHFFPAMERPLPPAWRRKAICVLAVVGLVLMLPPVVSPFAATVLGLVVILSLIWSFGVDSLWLIRHRGDA